MRPCARLTGRHAPLRAPPLRDAQPGGVLVHPNFLLSSKVLRYRSENDVALLLLSAPSSLAPAVLASANLTVPEWMVAAGWGRTSSRSSPYGGASTKELL